MRICQLNGGVFGSTGNIMFGVAEACERAGHSTLCASPVTTTNRNREPAHPYYKIGSFNGRRISVLLDRLTGRQNGFAKQDTRALIAKIKEFSPDILHLHNIHGSFVNLELLFEYIRESGVRSFWTLHDCWAFTGHCPHFVMAGCDKWKTECHHCPLYRAYPQSLFDTSRREYARKKRLFGGLPNMTIITPSNWLADLTRQSFLGEYPVYVVHNGIDLTTFRQRKSDFRKRHGLEGKKVVLGVSFVWSRAKGLDVFIDLARRLPEDYRLVLVGTNDEVDRLLPEDVISIHRTLNQAELAEIYTAANVFINPTREDTFPTVNVEALACGTPVITFRTGGSPESLTPNCGAVVACDDGDAMLDEILRACEEQPYASESCRMRAEDFDATKKYLEYLALYERKF